MNNPNFTVRKHIDPQRSDAMNIGEGLAEAHAYDIAIFLLGKLKCDKSITGFCFEFYKYTIRVGVCHRTDNDFNTDDPQEKVFANQTIIELSKISNYYSKIAWKAYQDSITKYLGTNIPSHGHHITLSINELDEKSWLAQNIAAGSILPLNLK